MPISFLAQCGSPDFADKPAKDPVIPVEPVAPTFPAIEKEPPTTVPNNPSLQMAKSVFVPGTPDTLAPSAQGCLALTRKEETANDSSRREIYQLIDVNRNGSLHTIINNLPANRSYGSIVQLNPNAVAITYESTTGFDGRQDGLEHGIAIYNTQTGQLIQDYSLFEQGYTRPAALLVKGAQLYVLTTNCSFTTMPFGNISCHDDSTLLSLNLNTNGSISNQAPQKIDLPGISNGQSLGELADGRFVVPGAGEYFSDPQGPLKIAVINPNNSDVSVSQVLNGKGIGLNRSAPLSADGSLLFTGLASNGHSIGVFKDGKITMLSVPQGVSPFISGAQFMSGGQVLFNTQATIGETNTIVHYALNPEENTVTPVGENIPGAFAIPFVDRGNGSYCSGVAASQFNEQGQAGSSIVFWQAQ